MFSGIAALNRPHRPTNIPKAHSTRIRSWEWKKLKSSLLSLDTFGYSFGNHLLFKMWLWIFNVEVCQLISCFNYAPNTIKDDCVWYSINTHDIIRWTPSKVPQCTSQSNRCGYPSIGNGRWCVVVSFQSLCFIPSNTRAASLIPRYSFRWRWIKEEYVMPYARLKYIGPIFVYTSITLRRRRLQITRGILSTNSPSFPWRLPAILAMRVKISFLRLCWLDRTDRTVIPMQQ